MHLYIGYKRYSSWSLRPWLAMKVADIPFADTVLPFAHGDSLTKFSELHGVPATVPVLESGGNIIWDSLAIMEYLAEQYPDKQLWPENALLRAQARSACAEMHCSFVALRSEHSMNCHRINPMVPGKDVQADLDRLAAIWNHFDNIDTPAGKFLCGNFGIVDAMFAPIVWRAIGYELTISDAFARWSKAMVELPAMQQWVEEGAAETWRVDAYEQVGT